MGKLAAGILAGLAIFILVNVSFYAATYHFSAIMFWLLVSGFLIYKAWRNWSKE